MCGVAPNRPYHMPNVWYATCISMAAGWFLNKPWTRCFRHGDVCHDEWLQQFISSLSKQCYVAGRRADAALLIIRHGLKLWIDGPSGTVRFVDLSMLQSDSRIWISQHPRRRWTIWQSVGTLRGCNSGGESTELAASDVHMLGSWWELLRRSITVPKGRYATWTGIRRGMEANQMSPSDALPYCYLEGMEEPWPQTRVQRGKARIRIAGASSTWQLRGGVVSCQVLSNLTRQATSCSGGRIESAGWWKRGEKC